MTDQVRTWGNTAGGNNVSAALFVEGIKAALMTDNLRQLQAAMRLYANEAEWFAIGDRSGAATFTFISATRFRVEGFQSTATYHVGRRVRATGQSTGIIHGTITASTLNGGNTDVTVVWDSGSLVSEQLLIELGAASAKRSSIPGSIDHDFAIVGALAVSAAIAGGALSIGGDAVIAGGLSAGGAIEAPSVVTEGGPFTLLSIERRFNGGSAITVPGGSKRGLIRMWSAGGGGSSAPDSFSSAVGAGSQGQTFTVSSSPSGFTLTMPGGLGGGSGTNNRDGRNASTGDGGATFTGSKVISAASIPGAGAPGGQSAVFGSNGNPGHYAEVLVDLTGVTSITNTGGDGGAKGSNPGEPVGGTGGRASFLVEFFG